MIDMVETYGYALLNSGQAETALLFESIYDEFAKSADFHFHNDGHRSYAV